MTTVVYIYEPVKTEGEELRYSLRSLSNYQFEHNVMIVGNPPSWYKGAGVRLSRYKGNSYTRAFDVVKKLKAAIESKNVTEDFIFMYDDQYVLQPTTLEHLAPCAQAEIQKGKRIPSTGSDKYKDLLNWTFDELDIKGQVWNYETHLPRKFNKTLLKSIIDGYNLTENPRLVSSLYYNEYFDKPTYMASDMKIGFYQVTTPEKIRKEIKGKRFLNHNDGVGVKNILPVLNELFPNPSKYE